MKMIYWESSWKGSTIDCFMPPPKFICSNLIPNITVLVGGSFERWLVHLYKSFQGALLLFPLCTIWGHSEKTAIYKPRSGLSPDTESSGALSFYFPASGIVRNKFVCLEATQSTVFSVKQPEGTKTMSKRNNTNVLLLLCL